ncbi:MAG: hypothetical protein M0R33_14600 [Methylomonas sp.]|uniref:hypothetical protein n=1 Tax=Methylomonas sp. TaxID=418 RepID=UPI0025DEF511|nr:hypothetical protein [Methylomonas sp.]MCK9607668.1 hypothetical protein [Methylomonas sp.]
MMKIRPFRVLPHRYSGLAMTIYLIVVGLTGRLSAMNSALCSTTSVLKYLIDGPLNDGQCYYRQGFKLSSSS